MILTNVEIYNKKENVFELFEAVVDTGSTFCVIEKGNADNLGLESGEIKESHKKPLVKEEFCTRPELPHPLTNKIIIGNSFLDKLSEHDYRKLFL